MRSGTVDGSPSGEHMSHHMNKLSRQRGLSLLRRRSECLVGHSYHGHRNRKMEDLRKDRRRRKISAKWLANEIASENSQLYSKIRDLYICKLLCPMTNLSVICLFE